MRIPGFDRLLASFPRPDDPLGYEGTWREDAVRRRLVPIYSDWVVGFAVDENGHVLYSGDEMSAEYAPLTNNRYRHIVLAQAAARFPELAECDRLVGLRIPCAHPARALEELPSIRS